DAQPRNRRLLQQARALCGPAARPGAAARRARHPARHAARGRRRDDRREPRAGRCRRRRRRAGRRRDGVRHRLRPPLRPLPRRGDPLPTAIGQHGGVAPRTARALPWASRALRAGVYLVLGGVIAAGYGVLVSGLVQLARAAPQVPMALTVALTVIAVPLALVPPFLAPVRDLGIAAARTFLDVDLPTTSARLGHDDRLRAAGYFVAHLLTGALATLALLFGIPYAVGLIGWTLGSRGDGFRLSAPDLGGWGVPVALLVLLALPLLALLGRALLRALAVPL